MTYIFYVVYIQFFSHNEQCDSVDNLDSASKKRNYALCRPDMGEASDAFA